jgi:hypothetical protein
MKSTRLSEPGIVLALFGAALQVGGFQSAAIGWALFAIGALIILGRYWDVELGGDLFPRSHISLKDAARRAYERSKGKTWAAAAEHFSLGPDEVLEYFATGLSRQVPIYGRQPPSSERLEVPKVEFNRGTIEDGGLTLVRFGDENPRYTDLELTRRGLRDALKFLDEQNDSFETMYQENRKGLGEGSPRK